MRRIGTGRLLLLLLLSRRKAPAVKNSVMDDGREISVERYTQEDWENLKGVGVRWNGNANLLRFINEKNTSGQANVKFNGKGEFYTTPACAAGKPRRTDQRRLQHEQGE